MANDKTMYTHYKKVFPPLSSVIDQRSGRRPGARKATICLVTPELEGVTKNGGIGSSCLHSAVSLAESGLDVTVLITIPRNTDSVKLRSLHSSSRSSQPARVRFLLEETRRDDARTFPEDANVKVSYLTYLWLKQHHFDVIMFMDWLASGYYSILAKRNGLFFHDSVLAVQTHSSTLWLDYMNRGFTPSLHALRLYHMEREAIRLADVVISPSQYLLSWMEAHAFVLPARTYHQPLIMPWQDTSQVSKTPIHELVFFGRLEERKGIRLFCDAVDELGTNSLGTIKAITFMGRALLIQGIPSETFIADRSKSWPCKTNIITEYGSQEAVSYLKGAGRLAVICSPLGENAPVTVQECLFNRIPFLATNAGGTPELMTPECFPRNLFDPDKRALAAKIREAVAGGGYSGESAICQKANRVEWAGALKRLAADAGSVRPARSRSARRLPLVSVCLVHYNKHQLLPQAVRSLESQTYKNFEVILVDDGSVTNESKSLLSRLEKRFLKRGWKLIRQENQYVGAARNNAARHAKGKYLLFMDDDNVAKPTLIQTMVHAAETSGADALSCFYDAFRGNRYPSKNTPVEFRYSPLGNALSLGIFENSMGDTTSLINRTAFEAIGGFTTDRGITYEDYELFLRLILKGFHVAVVPEPLLWYRLLDNSMLRSTTLFSNQCRALRPILESIPENQFYDALLYLAGHVLQIAEQSSAGTATEGSPFSSATANGVMKAQLNRLQTLGLGSAVIYGAGKHTRKVFHALAQAPLNIVGVIDDNKGLHGKSLLGWTIAPPESVLQTKPDAIIISSDSIEKRLYQQALELTRNTGTIVSRLYDGANPKSLHEAISHARRAIASMQRAKARTFAVYPAGKHTVKIVPALEAASIPLVGLIDDKPQPPGRCLFGWPIVQTEEIGKLRPDAILISSDTFEDILFQKMSKICKPLGIPVFTIYDTMKT